MKSPAATQALKEYLLRLPADKRAQLKAVTPQAIGQSLLLHISLDNLIENFQPYVTKRTVEGEDRSVPRVCVAPSLLGCLIGYLNDMEEFVERPSTVAADGRKVPFKGGWIIYGLPFDYALRPTDELLPGVERSDEHWLITYDRFTVDYRPVRVGKFFYERVEYRGGAGHPDVWTTMVVEVAEGQTLFLTQGVTLRAGYWKIQVRNIATSQNWRTVDIKFVREINEADYNTLKGAVANLLSFDNAVPPSMLWGPPAAA